MVTDGFPFVSFVVIRVIVIYFLSNLSSKSAQSETERVFLGRSFEKLDRLSQIDLE